MITTVKGTGLRREIKTKNDTDTLRSQDITEKTTGWAKLVEFFPKVSIDLWKTFKAFFVLDLKLAVLKRPLEMKLAKLSKELIIFHVICSLKHKRNKKAKEIAMPEATSSIRLKISTGSLYFRIIKETEPTIKLIRVIIMPRIL